MTNGFITTGNGTDLEGADVSCLAEDRKGNLWIGTRSDGIFRFNGKQFVQFTGKDGLLSNEVRILYYSRKFDLVLVGTNHGCSVFDGKKFTSLTSDETKMKTYEVTGFMEEGNHIKILSLAKSPVYDFYPCMNKFILTENPAYLQFPVSSAPVCLPNGDTVIGHERDGINVINHGLKKTFRNMGQVSNMVKDNSGNLWIACLDDHTSSQKGGLWRYDGNLAEDFSHKTGIFSSSVCHIFYDKSGSLWLGTWNTGLYQIPLPVFEWYRSTDFNVKSLKVNSVCLDDAGRFWVGTERDLLLCERSLNPPELKRLDTRMIEKFIHRDGPRFTCILPDRHGHVYAATGDIDILQYPRKSSETIKLLRLAVPGTSLIAFDSRDTAFCANPLWDEVFQIPPLHSSPKKNPDNIRKSFPIPAVTKILSRGDSIWFCSHTKGLFLTVHGKLFSMRETDPSFPRIITDLCFDRQGNIIAGSNAGEIVIFQFNVDGLFIKYRLEPQHDLIGSSLNFLIADPRNHLLAGTNMGLNRINLDTLYNTGKVKLNFFDQRAGYMDYSGKTAAIAKNGDIWVGTDSALLRINSKTLDELGNNEIRLKLLFIQANGRPVSDLLSGNRFKPEDNNLTFFFQTEYSSNLSKSLFRFRLKGLSDNWSDFSPDPRAVFNNLGPGDYRLQAEAYSLLNNSRIEHFDYPFTILTPYYKKWWVILMVALLGIALLWTAVQYRMRNIRKNEALKTELSLKMARIEMNALQSQMNPHFVFNALNSIQGFILSNKVNEAIDYLQDFSNIIRMTMDNATKDYITLTEEIKYIRYYLHLEQMRFDQSFKAEILVPDDYNTTKILIPPMVIQPFIENAIKHGLRHRNDKDGFLKISFSVKDKLLECVILDNGVGRKRSREIESFKTTFHNSMSTRITRERIELLNRMHPLEKVEVRTIDFSEDTITGTQVEISLPLILL